MKAWATLAPPAGWLRRFHPSGSSRVRNSLMAARALAREGIGIAALPCYLADPDARLKRVAPPIDAMASSLWLLTSGPEASSAYSSVPRFHHRHPDGATRRIRGPAHQA